MTKDQEYKLLFENWKQYVQEQAFDLPKTKTYKPSSKPDVSGEVSFEPPSFPLNDRSKLSDTLKKLGATIDAEDPDFMDTMAKAVCGLLSQMGVFMKLESELDNQDGTTESSAGGFSGWLLKQVGRAASISGKMLQEIAEFLPGCEGYEKLQTKWKEKQKTSTGTATGTTTNDGKGKEVKIKLPKCDGWTGETVHNKGCWQYYYSRSAKPGDSKEENNKKIADAKQKAREYIAKQAKDSPKKPEQKPGSNVPTLNISVDNDHVKVALQQLKIFGNGKLKETHKDSWPHIAKYWEKGAGARGLAQGTRKGEYKHQGKGSFADKSRWSAAFIQYCMRGNAEFQKLKNGYGKGSHRRYWMAARENTKLLKKGTLPEKEWFYLTAEQFSEIGYTPQDGDIGMMMSNPTYGPPGLHGDIYTPRGKVGGNLDNSVKIQKKPTVSIVTQNPEAREKFLKFHNPKNQNTQDLTVSDTPPPAGLGGSIGPRSGRE